MADFREIRWKIDGAYTAETMPLGRLAEYLKELAGMLGDEKSIHLIRVDTSSTVPILRIDHEAADRVRRRAIGVQRGMAPRSALMSYRRINTMLIEDSSVATLYEGTAEIIPFPGHRKEDAVISGIIKQGSLDGRLDKVGGSRDWVPIQLQPDLGSDPITGCVAKRQLAKEMGHHLFTPVRLFGRGKWGRSAEGKWSVERFVVDDFLPLEPASLKDAVRELRGIKVKWTKDPIGGIESSREDESEQA